MEHDIEEKRKKLKIAIQHSFDEAKYREITDTQDLSHFIQEQQELLDACQHRLRPSPDALGVERQSCSECVTRCAAYEPLEVFVLELSEQTYTDSFVPTICRNCKCPAYLHPPLDRPIEFPRDLDRGLRTFTVKEENLNFRLD